MNKRRDALEIDQFLTITDKVEATRTIPLTPYMARLWGGLPRVYRALSPRGNPTLKTLLALLNATGLRLGVHA